MKIHKKQSKITIGEHENPFDFFRRVRQKLLAEHDNNISKYMDFLREEQEKYKDRLVDVNLLRKKGLVK